MFKLHWTSWSIVVICLGAVLLLSVVSLVYDKDIPGPAWAIFSSVATGIMGLGFNRSK